MQPVVQGTRRRRPGRPPIGTRDRRGASRPRPRAASSIARASCRSSANGFSQITCRPASHASIASCRVRVGRRRDRDRVDLRECERLGECRARVRHAQPLRPARGLRRHRGRRARPRRTPHCATPGRGRGTEAGADDDRAGHSVSLVGVDDVAQRLAASVPAEVVHEDLDRSLQQLRRVPRHVRGRAAPAGACTSNGRPAAAPGRRCRVSPSRRVPSSSATRNASWSTNEPRAMFTRCTPCASARTRSASRR